MKPDWLPEAQGGLIVLAVTVLPVFAWTHRRHWTGWLAGAVSLIAVSVVSYHTFRGELDVLVPFMLLFVGSVPAWKPLLIGLVAGLGLGTVIVRWAHSGSGTRRKAEIASRTTPDPVDQSEPRPLAQSEPVPIRGPEDPQQFLWNRLHEHERELLIDLWGRPPHFMFQRAAAPWIQKWGVPEWSSVIENLKEFDLISTAQRSPPGASRVVRLLTWELSRVGKLLMAWHTRATSNGRKGD